MNNYPCSILVVDDVPKNIQLVANHLKEKGYNIYFATNGNAALELVDKQELDLILLDIMMPGMDGFDVCRKLQSNPKSSELPIIFLTAKTDIASIARGFKLGGVDYITKPFNKMELLARVRTHLELSTQKQELKELVATKDKFFSLIAHDLKNPFNHLLGLSQLILRSAENFNKEEVIQMAEMMQTAATKGSELLANLLDWSRAQTGTLKYEPENTSINQMINDNIDLLSSTAGDKNIELSHIQEEECMVWADENMVKTILRNLITNAIKFTPEKGKIEVSASKSGDMVWCKVTDTGIGMDSDAIAGLFSVNSSNVRMGTNNEKGTGLGLILCKELVEKHGGTISVKSNLKKGSTFAFSLPLARNEDSNDH